ncbi:MAG: Flp pilus assembly complex ATPase component TadA, partial [Planctomycetales bacterium]|nr:Flp pilus assembly complex ATPase component TadA [Planctomycetales bacterium]
ACLDHLNDGKRMIFTLEDPVEYVMKGVRQCQVNHKANVTFSELLRGILRQSPDIIMLGEIRDPETAHIAVRAANSGHLVLSTLHAPLAVGAVQTMLAFGVNPYFLANSLIGVVAQRLIRTLSPSTKKMYDISHAPEIFDEIRPLMEMGQGNVIYGPDEKDQESQGGYSSRSGLFEVLTIDRVLRDMIAASATTAELQRYSVGKGMIDFRRSALLKVAQGNTGVEEMSRAIPSSELFESMDG